MRTCAATRHRQIKRRYSRARPNGEDACDVVVVGGGPAGATAALLLARAGRSVVLLDRDDFPRDKACGDLVGAFAISELRRLKIDLAVLGDTKPLSGAFVYAPDGGRFGGMLPPQQAQRLGARVVPRSILDAALVQCAIAAGARFERERIADIVRDHAGVISGVRTGNGRTLRASITIGADGWSSVVARALVRTPRAHSDVGIAIRTYVDGLICDEAMRFYVGGPGDGYGWIFPIAGGKANVGLGFLRGERGADDLRGAFQRFLARPELRDARLCGSTRSWPIPLGWRNTPVSSAGALLVGDAASLASSLSGSGIHTAIASGAIAADVADRALERSDVSASALRAYDRRLMPIANRLRVERRLHGMIGTSGGSARAIALARNIPGAGRVGADWLLHLG